MRSKQQTPLGLAFSLFGCWWIFAVFTPPVQWSSLGYTVLTLGLLSGLIHVVSHKLQGLFTLALAFGASIAFAYGLHWALYTSYFSMLDSLTIMGTTIEVHAQQTATAQAQVFTPNTVAIVPSASASSTIIITATQDPRADISPTPEVVFGRVVHGGNLRTNQQIISTNILGQVCPGDQFLVLDHQGTWYHIRISKVGNDCHPQRVILSAEGWLSQSLIALK